MHNIRLQQTAELLLARCARSYLIRLLLNPIVSERTDIFLQAARFEITVGRGRPIAPFRSSQRSDAVRPIFSEFGLIDAKRLVCRALIAQVALASITACGGDSMACALLPDMTGLTVTLSAVPSGPYSVEVLVPRSTPSLPVSYEFRCDGGQLCRRSTIFFPGLVTPNASVRVTTQVGTRTTEYPRIAYSDSYPNGQSCEPRTTSATVTAALPE